MLLLFGVGLCMIFAGLHICISGLYNYGYYFVLFQSMFNSVYTFLFAVLQGMNKDIIIIKFKLCDKFSFTRFSPSRN